MGGRPKVPKIKAPNPTLLANLQAQSKMIEQHNPFGSRTFKQIGKTPEGLARWSMTDTFSPEMQGFFDQITGLRKGLVSKLENVTENIPMELDLEGLQEVSPINEEALKKEYEEYMDFFRPDIEREAEKSRARMYSSGFGVGSEASNQNERNIGDQMNRMRFSARDRALQNALTKRNEQYRLRNMQKSERLQEAQQPLTMLASFNSLIPQIPGLNFGSTAHLAPNVLKPYEMQLQQQNAYAQQKYRDQAEAYQRKMDLFGDLMGGVGSMFGGPLGGMAGKSLGGLFGSLF